MALIEMQLNHDDTSTQAIYDRVGRWKDRAGLMQLWADRIDEMIGKDKIIPINRLPSSRRSRDRSHAHPSPEDHLRRASIDAMQ